VLTRKKVIGVTLCCVLCAYAAAAGAQALAAPQKALPATSAQSGLPQRTRLILKDGSYQIVFGYEIAGDLVRYQSAERNGETEEIPLKLVDLAATAKWKLEHTSGGQSSRQVLSPELAREEAERRARAPEVAPDLPLPQEDSVLALDALKGSPELVPLPEEGSDLNKETAHSVLKTAINPASVAHRILEIPGAASDIQLHVGSPVFYVRLGEDEEGSGSGFVVDTHGAGGRETPGGGAASSGYVIERLEVHQATRIVDSFRIGLLGTGRPQPGVIEMKQETLPGGYWLKLTPLEPLDAGEYALVEVLSDHELNLNLWDFGIHAAAKENMEAMRPVPKKPVTLERRTPQ
jgi:hypothetical protein